MAENATKIALGIINDIKCIFCSAKHDFRVELSEDESKVLNLLRWDNTEKLWKRDGKVYINRHLNLKATHIKKEVFAIITDTVATIITPEIDNKPFLLRCKDKTLDFQSSIARNHRKDDLLTERGLPYEYAKANNAAKYQKFLRIFYVGKYHPLLNSFGRSCLEKKNTKIPRILWINGDTNTGKTSFALIIDKLVGGKASFPTFDDISSKSYERTRFEHDIVNSHLCVLDENTITKLDKGWLKRMTGGGKFTSRGIGQKVQTSSNAPPIIVTSNDLPSDDEFDESFYYRLRFVETRKPANFNVDTDWLNSYILDNPDELTGILRLWLTQKPCFDDGLTEKARFAKFNKTKIHQTRKRKLKKKSKKIVKTKNNAALIKDPKLKQKSLI